MGQLITHNTRPIWKTLIMAEQYLRQQTVKGTRHLKDMFIDTNSREHNRVFNPFTGRTLVNTCHCDKQQDMTLDWQMKGAGAGTNVTDGRKDHDTGYETPKAEVMESSQKSRSGEVRTRLGPIIHRPERLWINL